MDVSRPRLGIFGGTFDPIHIGHLFIAAEAASTLNMDPVVFVPTGQPHHLRTVPPVAGPGDRAAMVRIAIADNPRFELSTIEVDQGAASFTVDTLRALSRQRPDHELFFIVGMDSLDELPRWHDPEGLLDL